MEIISKAITDGSMERILELEKAQAQPAQAGGGYNRHQRRALAKLQRKDVELTRKIEQLQSTQTKEETSHE